MKFYIKTLRILFIIALGIGSSLTGVSMVSAQPPKIINIDFPVTDAVLSEDGNTIYLSSKTDYKLYIVDLTDGNLDYISFDKMPESLDITPQGDAIYLSLLTREHNDYIWVQEGYIAEIDPGTRSLVREFWIDEDPYDIVVTSNSYLYVSPGSGQWDTIRGYNLSSTSGVGSVFIRQRSKVKLHPSENYIYAPKKLVALVGVKNLVVVDTGDTLLICRRNRSQDVKDLVEQLKKSGLDEYL